MSDTFAQWASQVASEDENRRRGAVRQRAATVLDRNSRTPRTAMTVPRDEEGNIRRPAPGTPSVIEDRRPAPQDTSLLGRARRAAQRFTVKDEDVVGAVAAVGAGIVRAPGQLVGAITDTAQDVDRFLSDGSASTFARMGTAGRAISQAIENSNNVQRSNGRNFRRQIGMDPSATWADTLSARSSLGRVGNDTINQATTVIAASVIPSVLTGGVTATGTASGRLIGVGATGAFGGGVVNGPNEERLSNGLQALGVNNEFVDWLAQDDSDGALESRFKGALEGVLAEGALEGVFHAAKAARAMFRGGDAAEDIALARAALGEDPGPAAIREASPEEAAQEGLDRAFAQDRLNTARAEATIKQLDEEDAANGLGGQTGSPSQGTPPVKGEEAANGPEELPAGTRGVDALGGPDTLSDANAALAKAGSPEQLEGVELSPDGRILVSPQSKSLLDEAGMGAPFRSVAEQGPRDPVIFATEGRIVGSMERVDVQRFVDDIARGISDDVRLPEDLANRTGEWKIGNLNEPENVPGILRAAIERVPDKTPWTNERIYAEAQALSDATGEDQAAMLAFVQGFAQSAEDTAAGIVAAKSMWTRVATNINRHLDVDLDSIPDEGLTEITRDIHNLMTFSGAIQQAKSGLGRGQYAQRLTDLDTYQANFGKHGADDLTPIADDMGEPPLPRTREEVKDWLDAYKGFDGNPAGRADWLARKFKVPEPGKYLRQSIANAFTANMLSAPKTLMLNIVGPSIIGAVRTLEKTSGGYVGALLNAADPIKRAELLAAAQAAPTAYIQTMGDYQDAAHWAIQALKRGEPVLGGGGSIRDASGQLGPVSPALLKAANAKPAWQYNAGNMINAWPRALQRVNAGMDEFAKRLSYFGEARAQFLVEGATNGLRGADLDKYVRDELHKTTDILGHANSASLLESAQRTTLTGDVGADGTIARGFASGVSKVRQDFPESRFILPIFNVPANALGETLRRVPGVNFLFKESNRELAGELGPVRQAEAYGRFVTGASLLGTGFGLSRMGLVTGAGPTDPRDRAVWLQTHQPYSMKVGDQWVDYSRYDLVGALFAIPATLYDRSVYAPQDKNWEHAMFGGIAAMAEYMKDRAALQTVSDLLTFSGSPTSNPESFFKRLAGTTVSQLAVPNFVTALGRGGLDPYVRAKTNIGDYILDRLPGMSRTLDPQRNVLGDYIHKPQDSLLEGVVPITIAPRIGYDDDPEIDEIGRLYEFTGSAIGVLSPKQMVGGAFDPREVTLEDGGSMFNSLARNRGTVTLDGRTLRERLAELFASDEYLDQERAVDTAGNRKRDDQGRVSRVALVQDVFEDYTAEAKRVTAEESPTARRWLAAAKAKAGNSSMRDVSVDEAVRNPDLFDALGIDITTYEEGVTAQ